MKAVIFGAAGQDGHYLRSLLESQGIEVLGVGRQPGPDGTSLLNQPSVESLFKTFQPDYIFHLAANSTTRHDVLMENHEIIATGTLHILEAARLHCPGARIFISGSGLQFVNEGKPIHETHAFEARDAYSASRIYSVYLARYFRRLGLQTYVGYLFNHDSPLRTERHMSRKIVEAAKRIRQGSNETLSIGDPEVIKEWGFAGDIVNGIWACMQQERIHEVVIGTGIGHSICEWLDLSFSSLGLTWENHVTIQTGFNAEYRMLVCEPSSLLAMGWKPSLNLKQLCQLMLNEPA
ncbi:MAG: GDP-mannose 4,6-dehydratase [Ferruginibacter sp.]